VILINRLKFTQTGDRKKPESNIVKGSITVTGAFALYPMMEVWSAVYQSENPKVKIFLFPASSTKGNMAVVNNQADIGMFSKRIDLLMDSGLITYYPVAQDAVFVSVNSKNPTLDLLTSRGIDKEMLAEIFVKANETNWSGLTSNVIEDNLFVFTRSDLCGAGEMFAGFLDVRQEDLRGIGVYGDPGMVRAIRGQKLAIGYNNLRYIYNNTTKMFYDDMAVMPIDFNGNGTIDNEEDFYESLDTITHAIKAGKYPYPLARVLYILLQKEEANPLTLHFKNWVMTEGQKYVERTGYVKINIKNEQIKN